VRGLLALSARCDSARMLGVLTPQLRFRFRFRFRV